MISGRTLRSSTDSGNVQDRTWLALRRFPPPQGHREPERSALPLGPRRGGRAEVFWMAQPSPVARPPTHRDRGWPWSGPLLTLVALVAIESMSRTALAIPDPIPLLQ